MKKLTILLVILQGLMFCKNQGPIPESREYFVIEKFNKEYFEDSISHLAFDYYQKHNIIFLESLNQIYYHNVYFSCGTGRTPYDPPQPVDFTDGKLMVYNSIEEIVRKIKETENTPRLVMIASNVDTIWDTRYFALKNELELIDKCYVLGTRKVTSDEILGIESNINKK